MLRKLQQQFLVALFDPRRSPPMLESIESSERLSAEKLFDIYRDSVFGGLTEGLADVYPVCRKLVGEKFFDAMATRFIASYRSLTPDLTDYGEQFADFVTEYTPAASLPYLPDAARLEWYWHRAFNAPDSAVLDANALSEVDERQRASIVFHLPLGSALLASTYPIYRIWQVNQDDYPGEETVDLDAGGVRLFIWRQNLTMRIDSVSETEWWLLNEMAAAQPFGLLCTKLSEAHPTTDIGALFAKVVQNGWLVSFDV